MDGGAADIDIARSLTERGGLGAGIVRVESEERRAEEDVDAVSMSVDDEGEPKEWRPGWMAVSS